MSTGQALGVWLQLFISATFFSSLMGSHALAQTSCWRFIELNFTLLPVALTPLPILLGLVKVTNKPRLSNRDGRSYSSDVHTAYSLEHIE